MFLLIDPILFTSFADLFWGLFSIFRYSYSSILLFWTVVMLDVEWGWLWTAIWLVLLVISDMEAASEVLIYWIRLRPIERLKIDCIFSSSMRLDLSISVFLFSWIRYIFWVHLNVRADWVCGSCSCNVPRIFVSDISSSAPSVSNGLLAIPDPPPHITIHPIHSGTPVHGDGDVRDGRGWVECCWYGAAFAFGVYVLLFYCLFSVLL